MVTRTQLLELGFGVKSIRHRIEIGRLHRIWHGVYAVGRPELDRLGWWMAAVLVSGPKSILSHASAGELWGIHFARTHAARPTASAERTSAPNRAVPIHVSVTEGAPRARRGVVVHRRAIGGGERVTRAGIPVTSPVLTLIDLAAALSERELEAAVNDADKRGLVDPETLRAQLDGRARAPGIGRVRALLDRTAFRLTDSELERRFLRLVRSAKLPMPGTGPVVAGFKVDFLWRDLRLVVETDGLRYHRTPASQARDRVRDQALAAAGMTTLRFTHAQVAREPRGVVATLRAVIRRLELER